MLRTVAYHKELRNSLKSTRRHFLQAAGETFDRIHIERTLDEACYPSLSRDVLMERNTDQVITREYDDGDEHNDNKVPILTVAQLWLWRADNVVVSAFASPTQYMDHEKANSLSDVDNNDPLSGFDKEKHVSYSWSGDPLWAQSPDLLIGQLMATRIQAFGKPYNDGDIQFPPVLDIFERALASVLAAIDIYVRAGGPTDLDTKQEAHFIHIVADIRNEIAMIQDILDQQEEILSSLIHDPLGPVHPSNLSVSSQMSHSGSVDKAVEWADVRKALKAILGYRKQTEKIDRDAERIEQGMQNKLDVKRTDASLREARDAKRLSLLVIGFTVITVIFTPLAFAVSLFALPVDTWNGLKYTPGERTSQNADAMKTTGTNSSDTAEEHEDVFSGRKLAGYLGKFRSECP